MSATKLVNQTKYLLYVSYLGTRFSGLQKQTTNISIQGVLEHAFNVVLRYPENSTTVRFSSRTDSGVHALMNSCSVLLPPFSVLKMQKPTPRPVLGVNATPPYEASYLHAALNHLLWDLNFEIRVTGCRVVSLGFCPRHHAKSRQYLYRLAVLKPEYQNDSEPYLLQNPSSLAPLIELDRSWPIDSNFDLELFRQAAQMLVGEHCFASFMNKSMDKYGNIKTDAQRTIRRIDIELGRPLLDPKHDPLSGCFNYYDISIESKGFLYKQIRRMMSAMVAVARRHAQLIDVQWLLDNPHIQNWMKFNWQLAPPGGLYLKHIDYDPKDFESPEISYWRDMQRDDTDDEALEEAEEVEDLEFDGVESETKIHRMK